MDSYLLPVEDPFVKILRKHPLGTVLLAREESALHSSFIEWIASATYSALHDWEHGAQIAFRTTAWSIGPVTMLTIVTNITGTHQRAWFATHVNLFSPDLLGPKLLADLAIQPTLPMTLYGFTPQIQLTVSINNPLQQFGRNSLRLAKSISTPWSARTFARATELLASMHPTPQDLWRASEHSLVPPNY